MKIVIVILLALLGILILAQEVIAQPPVTQFERINSVEPIIPEDIELVDDPKTFALAVAIEYMLSIQDIEEMFSTINCESEWNVEAHNELDKHANSIGSHGISQFSMDTVKGWAKEIGIDDPDPYNYETALEIMAYAFSRGESYKKHWSCWRKFYQ